MQQTLSLALSQSCIHKEGPSHTITLPSLQKTFSLNLPRDVFRSVARFRLHAHTL